MLKKSHSISILSRVEILAFLRGDLHENKIIRIYKEP